MAAADVALVVLEVPGARSPLPVAGETVVVCQHEGSPEAVEVFPLGTCYARNRGALLTTAPNLTFVDSDGGFELTVTRERFLAARGFDHELGLGTARGGAQDWELGARLGLRLARPPVREALAAGRVARRRHDPRLALGAALRGGLPGLLGRRGWSPPRDALDHLPSDLSDAGPFEPLAAANPAKTHFSWRAGEDAVLHLHANPAPRLRRSLDEREAIRAATPAGSVPRLRTVAQGRDSLWVLEDLAPGRPAEAALPRLLEWAVELAGPPGPPLEQAADWAEHARLLQGEVPDDAVAAVARLPSRHMHGDLQPKNVLASGGRLTAIDWEGAWREGIPGLDLVYLALFAHGLDPAVLADPPAAVRAALTRVGVDDGVLPAALYVMLGTWATAEDRRRARLGSQPGEPFFRPLLAELGPGLR